MAEPVDLTKVRNELLSPYRKLGELIQTLCEELDEHRTRLAAIREIVARHDEIRENSGADFDEADEICLQLREVGV